MDLGWHPRKNCNALPDDQKAELIAWQKTKDGKKAMQLSRKPKNFVNNDEGEKPNKPNNSGSWMKKCERL